MLPKYENIWRNNGESEASISFKIFGLLVSAKLILKGNLLEKFPFITTFIDSNGLIDIEVVKDLMIETYKDFEKQNKKLIIPQLDWTLDEEDINILFNYAKQYEVKD